MNVFLTSLFLVLLQSESTHLSPVKHWTLKPNVLVVDVDPNAGEPTPIQLICGEALEGREISWRNEGVEIGQRGNRIQVTVEEVIGGNYSCHDSMGDLLNHSLVLVQVSNTQHKRRILQDNHHADYLTCVSRNYSGVFKCTWQWSKERKGAVVHSTVTRSSGTSHLSCSMDADGSGMTCRDESHCPYAEETSRVHLSVYVRYCYRLEKYARQFYISELVKPDQVSIEMEKRNSFTLTYPETWSAPTSYFPLRFQAKLVPSKKNCDYKDSSRVQELSMQNQTFSVQNQEAKYTLCVRARDVIAASDWSEWNKCRVSGSRFRCHLDNSVDHNIKK